jgi:hypothetical protein
MPFCHPNPPIDLQIFINNIGLYCQDVFTIANLNEILLYRNSLAENY